MALEKDFFSRPTFSFPPPYELGLVPPFMEVPFLSSKFLRLRDFSSTIANSIRMRAVVLQDLKTRMCGHM